jgi:hypothetical protein
MSKLKKTFEIILVTLMIIGIVEMVVGIFWTRTEWLTYVIRDKDFNWWAPSHIVIGLMLSVFSLFTLIKKF